jgi:hypothetical protein
VLRIVALVVALTLAVTHSSGLCSVMCASQAPVASDCAHHQDSTQDSAADTSVADSLGCGEITLVGLFVREEPGGSGGGAPTLLATLVPVDQIAPLLTQAWLLRTSAGRWTFDQRPLTTALRI